MQIEKQAQDANDEVIIHPKGNDVLHRADALDAHPFVPSPYSSSQDVLPALTRLCMLIRPSQVQFVNVLGQRTLLGGPGHEGHAVDVFREKEK
ncbi:hypothetical protein [Deinococcus humi]|uniref:Uncharacterized protein n=1 Tax=Deinococcus humi TaxID=662880 RepID=A0A7W8NGB2_9DEIO|nr:hypothetical protein [Deinococcus humi]MBB5365311.1 hypothetical protein [Deinococcus humi]GGO36377.1 hypothetical protein GCM10008949_40180 [Deinococcus humi]